MIDVKFLLLLSNTWNHLISVVKLLLINNIFHEIIKLCANKMSSGQFKNIIY